MNFIEINQRVEVIAVFRVPRTTRLDAAQGSNEKQASRTRWYGERGSQAADTAMRQEPPVRPDLQGDRAAARSSWGDPAYMVMPVKMRWRKREIDFTELGLRHPTTKGRRMIHVFDMSDGVNDYRLEFDAEMLTWTLVTIIESES